MMRRKKCQQIIWGFTITASLDLKINNSLNYNFLNLNILFYFLMSPIKKLRRRQSKIEKFGADDLLFG